MVDETLASLTAPELRAVELVVEALVSRDVDVLASVGAFERGADPYLWVDSYYPERAFELVLPPGEPSSWLGHVMRFEDKPEWVFVDVEIFDRTDGRSDLTVQLELNVHADGLITTTFSDLHVM